MSEGRQPAAADAAVRAVAATVAAAPGLMVMIDRAGVMLAVSRLAAAQDDALGTPGVGQRMQDVFPDGETMFRTLRAAGGEVGPVSLPPRRFQLGKGHSMLCTAQVWPWFRGDGAVGGMVMQIQDASAEAERDHTKAMLEAVVESMPSQLVLYDFEAAAVALCNRAYETFVDLPREKLIGGVSPPNFTAEDKANFFAVMHQAAETGQIVDDEREIADGSGRLRLLRKRARYIAVGKDGRYGLLVADDVTERRQTERALAAALQEAEAANRSQSAFLAMVSHEIRTPMNGVLGMVQAMANDELSEAQRERLTVIRRSGEALLALLNDVLDLSKIEAGKLELESVPFDLEETLRTAAGTFSAIAEEKGLELLLDLGDAAGVYRGDPTRVRQIVANLVANALKFTPDGAVRLHARRQGERVEIVVQDSGPGIPNHLLPRLFERFEQADNSTTRRFGGTGLGLAICRDLVRRMGGEIAAENPPEGGARFVITLPLERQGDVAPCDRGGPQAGVNRELRILAAEDNPINRIVLETLISQAGAAVTIVENGAAAFDAARQNAWDVILMDVQMPVMDGLEATRLLRDFERQSGRGRTPVIGLTANAMAHQRAEYLACGMDRVVAKPIDVAELFGAIEAVALRATPDAA